LVPYKRRLVTWLLVFAIPWSVSNSTRAADWASAAAPPATTLHWDGAGIPCSVGAPFWSPPAATAEDLPWASVWLGHFSGGRPYINSYGLTLIDWRDEKVCFSMRRECQAWIGGMRRAYHHPEGLWTCLLLR
jgi:hypothetical protein